jgi:uncharacterized RDD family membrane protein YckC
MKTIENLKVEKTFYKREKDFLGNVTRTPYNKFIPRKPVVVSPGVRFGYYFLDVITFYLIQIIFGLLIGIVLVATHSSFGPGVNIIFQLLSYTIWFFYYAIFETYVGGTVGKLICGYTVINDKAERITFGQGMLRTVIRMIPIEAFSCFGERGWHDKWSKTYVVKRSEKVELQRLLGTLSNSQEDILD